MSKVYERPGRRGRLRVALGVGGRAERGPRALDELSLTVERGASLGVIGHNGAGKSTMVKILAGVTRPTSGRCVIDGRVVSMLDAGVGFHPDLTGEENLEFVAVLQGASPREARRNADAIVEFAGLREFMDVPIKHYSSGMRARLSFATACSVSADVMVLDEALSTGDIDFRRRGIQRLLEMRDEGRTFVFVSHWLAGLEELADEVIRLEHGRLMDRGSPPEVLSRYTGGDGFRDVPGEGPVRVIGAQAQPAEIDPLDSATVRATLHVREPAPRADVRMRIMTGAGLVISDSPIEEASRLAQSTPGTHQLEGRVDSFPMAAGTYQVGVVVIDRLDGALLSRAGSELTVRGPIPGVGRLGLQPRWTVHAGPGSAVGPR